MQLPRRDLEGAATQLAGGWERVRGATILVTGATGFVGRWLVETFSTANALYRLGGRLVALSRDPGPLFEKAPHLAAAPEISWVRGNLENPDFFETGGLPGDCDFVVHAAGPSSRELSESGPDGIARTVEGTRRALDYAARAGARRFLYVSSGAVYGPRPGALGPVSEDFQGTIERADPGFAYAETKVRSEQICLSSTRSQGIETVIARGFSFLGPLLPTGDKFAAGSFLGDVLRGTPIRVHSDGTSLRSYLHAGDMSAWLWTILLRGTPGRAYNVGSERAVSIAELARAAASLVEPPLPVRIEGASGASASSSYVPSTDRARTELGLRETVDWRESLSRTYEWHRKSIPETMARAAR